MTAPEQQVSDVALRQETRPQPQRVVQIASAAVYVARGLYAEKQAALRPEHRTPVDADAWLDMHYAVRDTLAMTDPELWARATEYDGRLLPEDKLGIEERYLMQSLRDRNELWFNYYRHNPETSHDPDRLAMIKLREEVAMRTFRLAHRSQRPKLPGTDRGLRNMSLLTGMVTSQAWRALTTEADNNQACLY